ncbi:hypothetical protein SAMN05660710_03437 [Paracoccus tibetensis]|uniref:Uncharacterized protein n=1 Tax=Paracoccus tibetensis TaxID=336292 RepID=A0A1G5JUK7_9RHOB|nr:hypothetical protein SAMN05660710_03437 [Paracoccus tibetensis]
MNEKPTDSGTEQLLHEPQMHSLSNVMFSGKVHGGVLLNRLNLAEFGCAW